MHNSLEGKKAKVIHGHIELRSEKSPRNAALIKKYKQSGKSFDERKRDEALYSKGKFHKVSDKGYKRIKEEERDYHETSRHPDER